MTAEQIKKKDKKQLISTKDLLKDSFKNGFLNLINRQLKVFAIWELTIGEELAQKTKLESIYEGKLTVFVEAPAWIDHLGYQKRDIIINLNRQLSGEEKIKDIFFKIGPIN